MKKRNKPNPLTPIQNAQLLAIEGVLENTLDAFERKVRRWFSKEHSTPYLDTFKMPWDELLLHYYESNLANMSYNEVFDMAVNQYLPEFVKEAEDDVQAFADSLLKEQEATIQARKKVGTRVGKGGALKSQGEANKRVKTGNSSKDAKTQDKSQSEDLDESEIKRLPKPKTMSLKFEDSDPESI